MRDLRTFCVRKPKKENSTHHQLLKDPLSAMHLWVSALYKINSKNDLECIIHALIFKDDRIFSIYHKSKLSFHRWMKISQVSPHL